MSPAPSLLLQTGLLLILIIQLTLCQNARRVVDRECNPILNQMRSKGFSYPWWNSTGEDSPEQESTNNCPAVSTSSTGVARSLKCCKSFASERLMKEVQVGFSERWLGPKLEVQAKVFNESKSKFDATFKALLTRAHASFDAMFEKTYGMLYIQHAHVFHELFATFRSYYDNGKGSLDEKLNNFFAILTRKMFEVLNSQYEFDDAYLSCAAIVIAEKQGNELHRQIVSSLRRSFVATRALAQGLNDAYIVLSSLQKLEANPDCLQSLSSMLHCPICLEARAYKPCIPLCSKVSTGCVTPTNAMIQPWTNFLHALEGVIDRLLGPYNVEAVVEPIHIKISEAIMNFQESGPDFSQAVFAKCGKPNLKSRNFRKRDAAAYDPSVTPKTAERKSRPGQGRSRKPAEDSEDDPEGHKSLEKLLRETKKKVQKTKTLWEKLPQQVCNGISKDFSSQMCWNGTGLMRPEKNNKEDDPEVKAQAGAGAARPTGPANPLVADQILVLQFITDKLRASYNGLDVQWVEEVDEDDEDDLDVGSGQGSGSGDLPTDLDDSDDDDPNGDIQRKASPKFNSPPSSSPPKRPSFPSEGAPPIFGRFPTPNIRHNLEEEDDSDRDNSVSIEDNRVMGSNRVPGGSSDLPGFVLPPPSNNPGGNNRKPAVINNNNPTIIIKPSTTSRPIEGHGGHGGHDSDVQKNPTSGGAMDAATKTVAVFKLFTPIFVSMLGKIVSLS